MCWVGSVKIGPGADLQDDGGVQDKEGIKACKKLNFFFAKNERARRTKKVPKYIVGFP